VIDMISARQQTRTHGPGGDPPYQYGGSDSRRHRAPGLLSQWPALDSWLGLPDQAV